jgi:hypothetical protein
VGGPFLKFPGKNGGYGAKALADLDLFLAISTKSATYRRKIEKIGNSSPIVIK